MNGIRKTVGVHRLVAYAFYGIQDLTVNHINGQKEDNSLENLEYLTVKENNQHRSYILKIGNRKAVRCIETGEEFETVRECGLTLGIDPSAISKVCKKTPHHLTAKGLHFEYV